MEISAGKTNNGALPLTSINHISVLCRSVEKSLNFYQNVLGFVPVRRPSSLDFEGAWLFNYGIGIHILKSPNPENLPQKREINPKDNHISFQCESMFLVEKRLKEMAIPYVKCLVEESGILVDQLFFHDPDGFMIEVCNCENIPVIPIGINEPIGRVCKRVSLVKNQQQQQQQQPVNCDFLPKAIHVGDVEPQIHCA